MRISATVAACSSSLALVLACGSSGDNSPPPSPDGGRAASDAAVDAASSDSGLTGCARFALVADGTGSCSAGCSYECPSCPDGFPASLAACTRDGCIVGGDCAAICADLSGAVACTGTYTIASKDAAGGDAAPPARPLKHYFKPAYTSQDALFGYAVAVSTDGLTMAVGSPGESSGATGVNNTSPGPSDASASGSGAVYVFVNTGGVWSQQAYIKASNTRPYAVFGSGVALSADGSTLAVTSPKETSAATGVGGNQTDTSMTDAGAAYVFTRTGSTWAQQAYVKASNTRANAMFGWSIALSGDGNTLAVGSPYETSAATGVNNTSPGQGDTSSPKAGAAYVYSRSGTAWAQQAYVKASNTTTCGKGGEFGWSVAVSGNGTRIAVSALTENSVASGVNPTSPGPNDCVSAYPSSPVFPPGAVYVFSGSGAALAQEAYVKSSDTMHDGLMAGLGYGVALAADGNTLAAIAPEDGMPYPSGPGAVYVLTRGTGWAHQPKLVGAVTTFAISSDGSTMVKGFDPEIAGDMGSVLVYGRSGATWQVTGAPTETNAIEFQQQVEQVHFGSAVSVSGDGSMVAVGANGEGCGSTGVDGSQVFQCMQSSSPQNCETQSGAVYTY